MFVLCCVQIDRTAIHSKLSSLQQFCDTLQAQFDSTVALLARKIEDDSRFGEFVHLRSEITSLKSEVCDAP